MKTLSLILLLSLFIFRPCNSQELVKNEVDEFTKLTVKETSFEPIVQNFTMSCFLSVKRIDSTKFLQVIITIGAGAIHFIEKDASFYLKLSDESIVELKNMEHTMSCKGCAYTGRFTGSQAEGSKTTYILPDEKIELLQRSGIRKIRMYTSKGYIETEIKEQKGNVLIKELAIIE